MGQTGEVRQLENECQKIEVCGKNDMKLERFEDLMAWQQARELTRTLYLAGGKPPLSRDFALRDQLQRAAVSVMSNIAEGFERVGRQEKLQFMNIARASCAEVKSLLYICLDNRFLDSATVAQLQAQCSHISRLLSGLIRSVQDRKNPFIPQRPPNPTAAKVPPIASESDSDSDSASDSDSNSDSRI
jgi:four helix bundle protein